jgi:hypothetical protein
LSGGQAARLQAEPPEKKQERLQGMSGRQAIDYVQAEYPEKRQERL